MREIYVEYPVGMAFSDGAAVWSFDPDLWGVCIQTRTLDAATACWAENHGPATVAETIQGDEQAFRRDFDDAGDVELELTLAILEVQRARTRELLDALPDAVLDYDDPHRELPEWARWRTIRQMMWHICDTESRYYLPQTGLPTRERFDDLQRELVASQQHVREILTTMPRGIAHRSGGEVWTATKLLRRLAWHERGELEAIDALVAEWKSTRS